MLILVVFIALLCVGALGFYFFIYTSNTPEYGGTEISNLLDRGNVEACNEGSTESVRLSCVLRYMAKSRDIQVQYCENVNSANSQTDFEFQEMPVRSVGSRDVVLLETVVATAEDVCVLHVARQVLHPEICKELSEENLQGRCVEMVQVHQNPLDKIRQ